MEREALQKELLNIIANCDDVLLETLRDVAKEYNEIPEERMKLILQERENYYNGKGKSYSWEEAKAIVRNSK